MKSNKKKPLALLFGGRGKERDVSIDGADFVYNSIDREIYSPLPIHISKEGDWLVSSDEKEISPRELSVKHNGVLRASPFCLNGRGYLISERGELIDVYCIFPILHGDFGEDGIIQGALENAKIAYVGCDTLAGAVAIDKSHTKTLAQHLGIPTARWLCVKSDEAARAKRLAISSLGLPLFIKPNHLGSSFGASSVHSEEEFDRAFSEAATLDNRVIIEELVEIEAELECAYFSTKSKELFTKIGEIRYNTEFYDYNTKYNSTENVSLSTSSDYERIFGERIREYSRSLVKLLGIRDIARIDFFLSRRGEILFNEINTLPGFTAGSLYPSLLCSEGIPVSRAISELVENAANRR